MTDLRTRQQIEADDELTRAIQKTHQAYFGDPNVPLALTDYVVFAASQGWDTHGMSTTATYTIVRDNAIPLYRVRGLVENQLDHLRAQTLHTNRPPE